MNVFKLFSYSFTLTGILLLPFTSFGQTYETSAAAYWELQPQFIEDGNNLKMYFNLKFEDRASSGGDNVYDHVHDMNIQFNGTIIYSLEHTGLLNQNLGSNYNIAEFTDGRFANDTYREYIHKDLASAMSISLTHTSSYSNTHDVVQMEVIINPDDVYPILGGTTTSQFKIAALYYDRGSGSTSVDNAGQHYSNNYTVHVPEEDGSGNDEVDIVTAHHQADAGVIDLTFDLEKYANENYYDHAECLKVYHRVDGENWTLVATIGHNSLSCNHVSGGEIGSFTGLNNDSYTFNTIDQDEFFIPGQPTDSDGDLLFRINHYYDNDDFGTGHHYSVEGTFYARDFSGGTSVDIGNNNRADVNSFQFGNGDPFSFPIVNINSVDVSSTQCEIEVTWTEPTIVATDFKEHIGVYRNGVLVSLIDAHGGPNKYVDTDIQVGVNYDYQLRFHYERFRNGDLVGAPSQAISGIIPTLDAPFGLALTQGSCAADITVDWGWTGSDPANFVLQRKTSNTGFITISNTIPGGSRSFIDNNNITTGELYSYRIAAIDGLCGAEGQYTDVVTLTGDTIDVSLSIDVNGLETSKGYFDDRTELFWSTTGQNDQFLQRFKIYAREVGSTSEPTLLQTVNESVRTWFHETGDAGVAYEYFIVGERVVNSACGTLVTPTFEIASLDGFATDGNLPSSGKGVAHAIGFRNPTGIVNGNITYAGGVAVPDVKVVAEKYSGNNGNSLYFDGTDRVFIPHSNSITPDSAFTISMWVKPQSLGSSVMFQKNGSFGIEYSGGGQVPFVYIRDTTGNAHTLSGATGTMQVGVWVNLTATYRSSTGELKLFVNGEQSGGTHIQPTNLRDIQFSTDPLYLGCQNGNSYFYQGYMDEVRLYNRALSVDEVRRAAGAVSATDAPGLVGYWKMFVGIGNHIFDAAHTGSSYFKNDGDITGADWSTDIPSTSQLGFAGYTDANGNYSINGIGYNGTGENFNIVPTATLSGSVHEFDPGTRTLFIGEGSNIHNGIDFIDISSFSLSGHVKFSFDDVDGVNFKSSGSEGIRMYLDGQGAISGTNQLPIETDADGFFTVDIPIGQHFIEFRKNGHSFVDGGRFPSSGTWDFQEHLSGVQIWDSTTHILTGKVVGGTREAEKMIGVNRTINNIGKAKFTLTSEDGKIIRDIITDSLTGEYRISLPPKKYTSSDIEWVVNNADIISSGDITPVDLATFDAYNGTLETDSLYDGNGNFVQIDSSFYHLRRDYVHRVSPELVVNTFPELYYQSSQGDSVVNVDLTTLPFDTYTARKIYAFKMNAVEIYENLDNGLKDTTSVTDGSISINNDIGDGFIINENGARVAYPTPSVIPLDSGEVTYTFVATVPNTNVVTSSGLEHLSFTKQMSVNLTVGNFTTSWPNPADPNENYLAYVIGGKPVGTNFVTKSPEVVDFVLRDPPGSNSYAFLDQSTTIFKTDEWNIGGSVSVNARGEFGFAANPSAGFLGCANEEINVQANLFAEINVSFQANGGEEYTTETSLNTVFETNSSSIQIGKSDVFVAKSENLETGLAVHVLPVALNDCGGFCHGDTMYSINGDPFRMTRIENHYIGPFGGPTYTVYSESHIVNVLIPDLEQIRNSFLTSNAKYTSNIPPDHPLYGSNNDDIAWGSSKTSTNPIRTEFVDFDGPSYTFVPADSTESDSVRWTNQQIRLWKEALAENEIEKWRAIKGGGAENISLASGVTLTKSKTQTNSTTRNFAFELASSVEIGAHASVSGGGLHLLAEASLEVGLSASYANSSGDSRSITTGYILSDEDEDDALSIDVFEGEGSNTSIFSVAGGQTSCPHEDKIVMQYTTVDYLDRQVDIINTKKDQLQKQIDAQDKLINSSSVSAVAKVRAQFEKDRLLKKIDNLKVPNDLTTLRSELLSGEVLLSNATLQRDKPTLLINGAKTAQAFNVPADQKANFTLLLQNESESGDDNDYAIELLDGTNPHGLILEVDGQSINTPRNYFVPGGSAIQKILQVERGPFEYNYNNIGVLIHSVCQYDPAGGDALIVDTVYFNVSFLPTCTDVEIVSPDNMWVANNASNNSLPITVGGYDVNEVDFEKIKVQYKPSNSSGWTLLETYFRDTTIAGWSGEPLLPQSGNLFTYNWALGSLPDGNYDIRAVATCTLAETESVIHTGLIDRQNIEPFGIPLPSDGILSFGEEVSIQFNETVNSGLLSSSNIDVRGVLNGGDIRHETSIYFDGNPSNTIEFQQVNLANKSFTIEFYAKRDVDGLDQTIVSHGVNINTDMNISFNPSNLLVFHLGPKQLVASNPTNNNWHHYAISFNPNTGDAQLYIDGVLDNVDNSFNVTYLNNENLLIGISNTNPANPFTGNMHELRIWSKELSASEINYAATKRMAGNEAGLLFNWVMEEARGIIVHDKVRGKHGQMNATWVVSPLGYGLRLNGNADQAQLPSVTFGNRSDFTIEFWFKSDGGTDEVILSNGTGDSNDANSSGWSFGIGTSGHFTAISNDEVLNSNQPVNDGIWHHMALVVNARGNATLFVDAQESASITNDSLNGFAGPAVWIGQRAWFVGSVYNNDRQFTGNLDELRIWKTARSLAQIDRDRYNKLTGDEPGLQEYYPFDVYTTNSGITSVSSTQLNQSTSTTSVTDTLLLNNNAVLNQNTPTIKLKRPIQSLNFTYSVNNDKIIITPTATDAEMENIELDFTVSNVQDENGNTLESPVTWTAFVNRNQVVWQDQDFYFDTIKGSGITFVSNVVNNSGQNASFNITNIPNWLDVSPTSGNIGPLSSLPITFDVLPTLNSGTYQQDVHLTTSFGYPEGLDVNLKVKEVPPVDWIVDPSQFQFSMNIVGQIAFNGQVSRNEDDLLGAFVNGQCRGVVSLEYLNAYDNYQAFLTIYSNIASGEEIEYKVWNSRTGAIHTNVIHTLPSTTFISNSFYGSPSTPELFDATNVITGSIDVAQGWNWISFNLEGTDLDTLSRLLSNLNLEANDIIKTRTNEDDGNGNIIQRTGFDSYDPNFGWGGSISQNGGAQTGVLYKLKLSHSGTIVYDGELVNPLEDTINLVTGWNYLGYTGNISLPITEALSNYNASTGDVIKSQLSSAIYDAGFGWLGNLTTLKPNVGYMITSAIDQSFSFTPSSSQMRLVSPKNEFEWLLTNNPWTMNDHGYSSNMTVIARIKNLEDLDPYISDKGLLGAFVDGVCRGFTYPIYNEVTNEMVYVITIIGDASQENIEFRYYDSENNRIYDIVEHIFFEFDQIDGTRNEPTNLQIAASIDDFINSSGFTIYPNPFNEQTNVLFDLNNDALVRVSIEDLSGKTIKVLELGKMAKGKRSFTIGRKELSAGVYFIKMHINNTIQTDKLIITDRK